MKLLINLLIQAIAVLLAAYFLPNVTVPTFLTALFIAVVLAFFNAVLRPILVILTLPINILTLGLFTLVIDVLLILLTAAVVPGFEVVGFFSTLLFGLLLSLINMVLFAILGRR